MRMKDIIGAVLVALVVLAVVVLGLQDVADHKRMAHAGEVWASLSVPVGIDDTMGYSEGLALAEAQGGTVWVLRDLDAPISITISSIPVGVYAHIGYWEGTSLVDGEGRWFTSVAEAAEWLADVEASR